MLGQPYGHSPWGKVMLGFHVLHNIFEGLLFLNVHSIARLLFAIPVVNHFSSLLLLYCYGRRRVIGEVVKLARIVLQIWLTHPPTAKPERDSLCRNVRDSIT